MIEHDEWFTCPVCAYDKLGRTCEPGREDEPVQPKPGDATICAECGALLIFVFNGAGDKITGLRPAPKELLAELDDETRAAIERAKVLGRKKRSGEGLN